jgi:glycosyltransferase involved in cell wall biosynthesis
MTGFPRISVVTCSRNQGKFIGATIESVLAQKYPNVEHIVVDAMSTDETPQVLARYGHLRVIREPDRGQAEAINKGFRMATGEIFCFLNSDDTLVAGALDRVVKEIDPARGRSVVMGRCRFIAEDGSETGIEHPSHYESYRRVLEIWKGHFIPQPAVFWTAEVWRECGGMEEGPVLDYDLFCRFAKRYRFHTIDQVLAAYRLHPASKTCSMTDQDRLENAIQVSRRYWGSPFSPFYWRLAVSLALYRFNRLGRAHRLYLKASRSWANRQRWRAIGAALPAGMLAPELAFHAVIGPVLGQAGRAVLARLARRWPGRTAIPPQTAAYLGHTATWEDGWAGPLTRFRRTALGGETAVAMCGSADLKFMRVPLCLTVRLDGVDIGAYTISASGPFLCEFPLERPLPAGEHAVEVEASAWWVPHRVTGSGDYRPLAWKTAGADSIRLVARQGSTPIT